MIDLFLTLVFAFLGGLLPALIWLWYWLKKDKDHPEPNGLIIKTFIFGMLMVPIAFILQSAINYIFLEGGGEEVIKTGAISAVLIIVLWAFIEELVKYAAASGGGLRNKANDEPIDVPIYMITAALGFAALENMLFLITPILEGNLSSAFLTGNMRFIGATLVHVSSSALIGIFGSISYFLKREVKRIYIFWGFVFATALHTVFNLFIINHNDLAYLGFITVWIFTILIAIIFEQLKKSKLSKIQNV